MKTKNNTETLKEKAERIRQEMAYEEIENQEQKYGEERERNEDDFIAEQTARSDRNSLEDARRL